MNRKVRKRDVERFEKAVKRLGKVMEDINEYNSNVDLVCFPTTSNISLVFNDNEDDYFNCEVIMSVYIKCNSCS